MDANDEALSLDLNASTRYREDAVNFCRYWFGLEPLPRQEHAVMKKSSPHPETKSSISAIVSRLFAQLPRFHPSATKSPSVVEPDAPNLPTGVFKEFGERVSRVHSKTFRENFAKEIKLYFDHCEIEQRERLTGETSPDLDTYLSIRYYTSAVRLYCYITQCVPLDVEERK